LAINLHNIGTFSLLWRVPWPKNTTCNARRPTYTLWWSCWIKHRICHSTAVCILSLK